MKVSAILNDRTPRKDGLYPIVVWVRHDYDRRMIPVGYRIDKDYWDKAKAQVSRKHPDAGLINAKIGSLLAEVNTYYNSCMLHNKPFNVELIGTGQESHSFNDFLEHRAKQFEAREQIVMMRKVRRMAKELKACFGVLSFDQVNQDRLRDLETFMIKQKNGNNTRDKKFANYRQFFTQAIKDGKATGPNPFDDYKIVKKPVKKPKLTLEEIVRLECLDLAPGPINDARNLFLFSYYAKGMRFENCVTLKKKDIIKGRIVYRSNKGNKHLSVLIHSRLQRILDFYNSKEFIFPFVKEIPKTKTQYISMIGSTNAVVNRNLKFVAAMAEIDTNLTVHIARHTFAQHMKQNKTDIYAAQEALGHGDVRTTQKYMDALGDETLDYEMNKIYGD